MTKSNTKTTNKTENGANRKSKLTELTNRPPSGRRDLAPQRVRGQETVEGWWKGKFLWKGLAQTGRRRFCRWPDDWEEDDQSPGWNRQREELGAGGDGRRSRAQLGKWPMVEPMEGGAIEEKGLTNTGGQLTLAEQVGEEPSLETESPRTRVT